MIFKKKLLAASIVFSTLAAAGAIPAPVLAQEEIEEVTVIGTFRPIDLEKLGNSYTIMDQAEIEATGAVYIPDVLRQVPSMAVSRTGPGGGVTTIRVRGSEGNHVLVLVDGIEINSISGGEVDFSSLMTDNVERIEVLRGPQSGLYGSNATAGVINIITKSGAVDPGMDVTVEGGTLDNHRESVRLYGGSGNFNGSLGVASQEMSFNGSELGSEKDDDSNLTVTGKATWSASDALRLDASIRSVDKESDTDGYDFSGGPNQGLAFDDDSYVDTEELNFSLGGTLSLNDDRWQTRLIYSMIDTESAGGAASSGPSSGSEGKRDKFALNSTLSFSESSTLTHSGTVFVEHEEETYRNTRPSDASQIPEQARTLLGMGVQYHAEFSERLFVTAAGRRDNNDNFNDTTTYSVNAAFMVSDATRLHTSVGKGVTNPTFFEQFGFTPGSWVGNPGLQPEKSQGWDIGIEQKFADGDLTIDLTYFDADLQNEIGSLYDPALGASTPINATSDSDRDGFEVASRWDASENFSISGTYTNTDAVEAGGIEVRRPEHMANLSATWRFNQGRGMATLTGVYNGEMFDNDYRNYFVTFVPEKTALDSYFVTNLSTSYQFTDSLQVYLNLNNLFDEDYQEVMSYATPGFWGTLGLRMSFQ